MHQTNGGFVYVGLNANCSRKVSERQQSNNIMVPLAYFRGQYGS